MLRLIEGWELYFDPADLAGRWTGLSTTGVRFDDTGNSRGGRALVLDAYGAYVRKLFDNRTLWVVGFRFRASAFSTGAVTILELQEASSSNSAQVRLELLSDGRLQVTRNGTGLSMVSTKSLQAGKDYYLELKALIADSGGTVEVRVNGRAWIAGTGLDTRYGGDVGASYVALRCHHVSSTATPIELRFWDVYVLDNQAGLADFLGPQIVDTLLPEGAGDAAQFTSVPGGDNWDAVNDAHHSFDDHFVESQIVGYRDLHHMPSVPDGVGGITAVALSGWVRKSDDSAAKQLRFTTKLGATEYDGSDLTLAKAAVLASQLWVNSPDTGTAWTRAEIAGMQAGYEIVS